MPIKVSSVDLITKENIEDIIQYYNNFRPRDFEPIEIVEYTPLNIINRTPKGRPVQCSRATLPENQLYQAPIFDGRPDSNVHRCIGRMGQCPWFPHKIDCYKIFLY